MHYLNTIKLFQKGYGRYKFEIVALAGLGLMSGFIEGIGINLLLPLFSRITGSGGASDFISRTIGTVFTHFEIGMGLKLLLLLVVFAFIFKAIVLIISKYVTLKIAADYEYKLRSSLFSEALFAAWPFLLQQKVGYLETVLMKDIQMSAFLLRYLSAVIIGAATLAVYTIIAFNISPTITLVSLGFGGLLFLLLKPLFFQVRQLAGEVSRTNKEIAHYVNENIIGIKAVKSNFVQERVSEMAYRYFELLKTVQLKVNLFRDIPNALIEPASVIFVISVFSFSYLATNFDLAVFAVTMYLIHRIFSRMQSLQAELYKANEAIPYLQSAIDFLEQAEVNREEDKGTKPFILSESLEFFNVSFSYGEKGAILKNMNVKISEGEMVGLIGKSGSGKTTFVDLLLKLLNPSSGAIMADGIDIKEIGIVEWRKNIGYVSQEIFLINDTIENNLRFYDDSVSNEDMIYAAKMAYIYDFIQRQPNKFRTQVGERGMLLSGGERQRMVLARTLARHPKILILDEATSALDNESEAMIQRAIENLKGKITIIVIAHRLSTILNCDRALVLEGGRIREDGAPKTLLKDKTSYFYRSYYNIRENTA